MTAKRHEGGRTVERGVVVRKKKRSVSARPLPQAPSTRAGGRTTKRATLVYRDRGRGRATQRMGPALVSGGGGVLLWRWAANASAWRVAITSRQAPTAC